MPKVAKMSSYEAGCPLGQEALYLMRTNRVNPGTILSNVIDLMATAGVWPEDELMELTTASRRTLQRYRKKGYLDLVVTPHKLTDVLEDGWRPSGEKKLKIYCLGPIGLALAELKHGLIPKGYLSQGVDRVTHDVLCNLVYYHLYKAASEQNYFAILKSKYEATLHNHKGQPILEPDAMIVLQHEVTGEGSAKIFVVEYHNENFRSRAGKKIRKYEHIYREGYWRDQWNVETFPPILIVTTHRAPATGYNEEIQKHLQDEGLKCTYLIKSLKKLLDGSQSPLVWLNLEKNRPVNLLEI